MPNFITAKLCGSFCRFIEQSLDQQIACKPVGRRRGSMNHRARRRDRCQAGGAD
jgi:hypothetical protein